MKNKNMMITGIVMMICQFLALVGVALIFAFNHLSTISIQKETAALIIGGVFFGLILIFIFVGLDLLE